MLSFIVQGIRSTLKRGLGKEVRDIVECTKYPKGQAGRPVGRVSTRASNPGNQQQTEESESTFLDALLDARPQVRPTSYSNRMQQNQRTSSWTHPWTRVHPKENVRLNAFKGISALFILILTSKFPLYYPKQFQNDESRVCLLIFSFKCEWITTTKPQGNIPKPFTSSS